MITSPPGARRASRSEPSGKLTYTPRAVTTSEVSSSASLVTSPPEKTMRFGLLTTGSTRGDFSCCSSYAYLVLLTIAKLRGYTNGLDILRRQAPECSRIVPAVGVRIEGMTKFNGGIDELLVLYRDKRRERNV